MTAFEMVALALSFIGSLGVAHLLSSSVAVFRDRRHHRVHWMPAIWSLCILLLQIQFWWAIFGLSPYVKAWTLAGFGVLLMSAVTLFIAGACSRRAAERRWLDGHAARNTGGTRI